ncbi:hypothetical protein ACFOMD_07965 [Sphingoaurantiacus capsulatus]|uniref:Uncharacterized protein n=1 Tax=Sphingoaurantiacus capsulatus TaxID=1771310 RepID=A0ABV7X8M6_9SPHN
MKASRWMLGAVLIVALGVGGLFALRASPIGQQTEVGVGYGARTACACRYLGNRSLDSCKTDFEPGMEMVRLSEDPAAKRITATVPLIASRSATYAEGYGCTLNDD